MAGMWVRGRAGAAVLLAINIAVVISVSGARAAPENSLSSGRSSVFVAPAAGGGDGCNPNRPNNYLHYNFAGATSHNFNGTPGGVYADISNYSPFVAGPNLGAPSYDSVSEWVMLLSSNGYAQIGWIEFAGAVRNTFVEYTTGGGNFTDDYFTAWSINSTTEYTVEYHPTATFHYWYLMNGTVYLKASGPPAPSYAEIDAEIHTNASQIPGGYDDTGTIGEVYHARVWPTAGTDAGWQYFNGTTPIPGESWIGLLPQNSTDVNHWWTWDAACPY